MVEPKGAAITVDDKHVENAELVADPDSAEHTLKVTAPGYKPHEEKLTFDSNQKLVIHLDRASKATPLRPPKKQETKEPKRERIDTESPYK